MTFVQPFLQSACKKAGTSPCYPKSAIWNATSQTCQLAHFYSSNENSSKNLTSQNLFLFCPVQQHREKKNGTVLISLRATSESKYVLFHRGEVIEGLHFKSVGKAGVNHNTWVSQ